MGSIVLGGIGSSIAGPIGGLIGGQLGSFIDQKFFNHRSAHKPSLQDLQVEAATMGLPIPKAYGRNKIAGNVIMSTMLLPKENRGKGGSAGKSSQTTYTYTVNCGVAICKGPIKNIWRIYADAKIIWDMDPGFTQGSNPQPIPQSGFVNDQFGGFATLYHFGAPGTKDSNTQLVSANAQFYFGSEEQLQDAALDTIMQSYGFAAGSVPAYRGLAYVVFINFPLADFGNRIPNFAFEVNGFYDGNLTTYSPTPLQGNSTGIQPYYDLPNGIYWQLGTSSVSAFNSWNLAQISQTNFLTDPLVSGPFGVVDSLAGISFGPNNNMISGPDTSIWIVGIVGTVFGPVARNPATINSPLGPNYPLTHGILLNIDARDGVIGAYQLTSNWGWSGEMVGPNQLIYCGSSNLIFVGETLSGNFQVYDMVLGIPQLQYAGIIDGAEQTLLSMIPTWAAAAGGGGGNPFATPPVVMNHYNFVIPGGHPPFQHATSLSWSDQRQTLVLLDGAAGVLWLLTGDLAPLATIWIYPSTLDNFSTDGGGYRVIYDPKNDVFLFYNNQWIYTVKDIERTDPFELALESVASLDVLATFGANIGRDEPFHIQQYLNGGFTLWFGNNTVITVDTLTLQPVQTNILAQNWSTLPAGSQPSRMTPVFTPMGQGGIIYTIDTPPVGVPQAGIALYQPVSDATITLAEIVDDICLECGLTDSQINVSELTEGVYGYTISQEASGRAAIEQLEEVFLFDMVESNGKLTGRHRLIQNQSLGTTILEDDLGARVAGPMPGENAAPRVIERIKQDFEIPQAVTIRYRTTAGDYRVKNFCMEMATQYTRRARVTSSGVGNVSLNTPLVLNDTQAAQIVETALRLQYVQRTTLETSLPIKYIAIETGDVCFISWTDPEGNTVGYQMYIQQADIGADNTIKLNGMTTNAQAYVGHALGGGDIIPIQQPMVGGQPTSLRVMELPPLQDSDDSVGVYWAACGIGDSYLWSCQVDRSIDAGANYIVVGATGSAAAIGIAKDVLPGGINPGEWDTENELTLVLTAGSLESFEPTQVLSRSGVYLVGNEILGAANAVENDDGSWTLSILLRGMQGTDIYVDSHVPGERVIALRADGTVQDDTLDLSSVGQSQIWAGVTIGSDLGSARHEAITIEGTRIKPLAAQHAAVARTDDNSATIFWNPRNRTNFEWIDGTEQLTDEVHEAYEVDIYRPDGTTFLRTIREWTIETGTVGNTLDVDTGRRYVEYSNGAQEIDLMVAGGAVWDDTVAEAPSFLFTNGNLSVQAVAGNKRVYSNHGAATGKWYFEVTPFPISTNTGIGFQDATAATSIYATGFLGVLAGLIDNGLACGIAADLDAQLFWVRRSPSEPWMNNPAADPVAGVLGHTLSGLLFPIFPSFYADGAGNAATANFGGSSFGGIVPVGYSYGWPGLLPPAFSATIYQVSSRIGRGFPRIVTG